MPTPHMEAVRLLSHKAGQPTPSLPTEPAVAQRILRLQLIMEEAILELSEAFGITVSVDVYNEHLGETTSYPIAGGSRPLDAPYPTEDDPDGKGEYSENWTLCYEENGQPFNLRDAVDALTDGCVVVTGGFTDLGVDDEPVLAAVDENNLAKFGPGGYRSDGTDGNSAGKWIKPPNHPKPDIDAAIEAGRGNLRDLSKPVPVQQALPDPACLRRKSFLFSFGNSSEGPVGFCARVFANTADEAAEALYLALPESFDIEPLMDLESEPLEEGVPEPEIEYVQGYSGPQDSITPANVEEWEYADGHNRFSATIVQSYTGGPDVEATIEVEVEEVSYERVPRDFDATAAAGLAAQEAQRDLVRSEAWKLFDAEFDRHYAGGSPETPTSSTVRIVDEYGQLFDSYTV